METSSFAKESYAEHAGRYFGTRHVKYEQVFGFT
jgi:hypothetical protein